MAHKTTVDYSGLEVNADMFTDVTTDSTNILTTDRVGYQIEWNGFSAATFSAAATDICTVAGHGFLTGLKVQVSSTTTLPAGLSAVTDYWVIVLDVDTFKLSDSRAHALAGTDIINITDAGTGTHTVTPQDTAPTGTFSVEVSNDTVLWAPLTLSTPIAAAGTEDNAFIDCESAAKYIRLKYTATSGNGKLNVHITAKSISG